MAVKNIMKLFLFYLSVISVIIVNGNKLNTLKVLLPIFNEFRTNFTLEADGGCYKWSTSRLDIIQITSLDYNENLDCSNRVVVSCITKEQVRKKALVIAENVNTGHYLRCDIIVDVIHSLTIITRTREILLEEDPVKILVRAYDNLGNEFSSLFGVEFNWRIVGMGPNKDSTVLNIVKFDDSPYESPPGITELEAENTQGNVVLVEGLKTGSAKISVSLPHEECKSVEPNEVQFSVIANLILVPQDVYLMMGDIISFRIFHLSYGNMEEIVLPNKQYYLKTDNSGIAVADQYCSEVTGLALGKTRVHLYDRNSLDTDPSATMPSAMVNVVEAAYIRLSVLPHRNWAILVSEHHDIIAEVFTNTDNKINLGTGVELHTQVNEPFHVNERASNGSWLRGWGLSEGVAVAQGTLEAVTNAKYGRFVLDPPLSAQNDLEIFLPITVTPAEVILPWDPIHRPKYQVEVVASGGDGKYIWTSTDHSVGVVSQAGMARTHSHGFFEVAASMPRNHINRASAKFWILPPIRLEIVEFVAEAEVGSTIFLHVALYAERPDREGEVSSQIPFTMCQDLPFQIVVANNRFSHEQKLTVMPVGISCTNVALVGHNVGNSKVTVSYTLDGIHYQDSVSVSAFKPLSLIRPTDDIVLAVGSQIYLIFTGGPRPSPTRPQDHHRRVSVENDDILLASDDTDRHTTEATEESYTIVKVVCLKLGETKTTLSIGNQAFVPNCKTTDTFITVPIICGKPRSISVQPKIKVADAGSCPMDLSTNRVVVQSNQDVELDVVVRDDCGRTFLNITSFQIDWKIESSKLGVVLHKNGVFPDLIYLGTVPYGSRHYQVITPKAETGIIVVTPTLTGYRSDILGKHDITAERPVYVDEQDDSEVSLPAITASVSLYLVDDTVITPDEITLYNHPANKKYLSVKQGSGFYELGLSTGAVADVEYQKSSRQIVITPKEDGELKITLIDLCLVSRPSVVIVNVVSVATIRAELSDKVEINKCISCIVRLYDETDNLLNIPDMSMVNLQVSLLDKIATITPAKANTIIESGEIHYTIKGTSLGDTKLLFTVSGRDPEISTSAMDLQVFPPLKLHPRNGTLIIGAVLQYSSKGGPQPDSHIEYSVKDKITADVGHNGILQGLRLGSSIVMATAIGTNPTTGQKLIYTEDAVEVQIIPLTGIRISAPLSRFQTTTTVPMWATGIPDQLSPLIIGTRDPPIKFDWAVDDANVAVIAGLFHPTGIQYEPEDMISIRVTGTAPGRTKIRLNATVPGEVAGFGKQSIIFAATLELEVFEGLELVSPKGISGRSILMAPSSHLQLLTNKDYETSIKYSLMDDSAATPTDLRRFGGGSVVSISETGRLESHNNLGYSMILISATDEFGLKQTVSAVVEIKPIHYMLMRINAKWEVSPPGPVVVIPLGTEFELRASYHDNTGVAFTAGITELKLRTSRFDLVKVKLGSDNSSVTLSARKPGMTIVKIWADGVRKTADYVKLHVEQVIEPQLTTVTTGDIICFQSPLASRLRSPGTARWSSTEPHIISVLDTDNGILQASGVRGGRVAVVHSLHPSAPLQVLVQPISEIYILPDVQQKSLVSNSKEVFRVPLVLRSGNDGAMKTNNLVMGWDCIKKLSDLPTCSETIPFVCHLEFIQNNQKVPDYSQYLLVSSEFNPVSGQYSCDILPNLDGDADTSTFSTNITLWAVSESKEIISNSVQIPFLPAVQFNKQLDMDGSSSSQQLVINGLDHILDQVVVTPVDSSIINVGESSRPKKNVLVYDVQLIDYHPKLDEMPDHMSVELSSPLTEQSSKILVNAKAIGSNYGRLSCPVDSKSPVGAFFTNYPQFIVIIVSMAIIFSATYYIYIQCMQPVLHVDLRSNAAANLSGAQQMRMSPYLGRNCAAANASMNNSCTPRLSSTQHNATLFNNSAPVYGDPNTFYNTSPELRRNRRYI